VQAHCTYGVELWSSEDYSCWTDPLGAAVWASEVNSQWIGGNITLISAWHLVNAAYPTVSFWNEGIISASQPWSGHFVAAPTVWASAHTTQFTTPGESWYLPQGKGAGALQGGGSYVSFSNAARSLLTIVIESAGAAVAPFCDSNCNGVCALSAATANQTATFALANLKLKTGASLALWRTKLGAAVYNEAQVFEQLPDASINNGAVTITVEPDCIYTLSTQRTATKAGNKPLEIPASEKFPLPFRDDFEDTDRPLSAPGKYWADMDGGFEVAMSACLGVDQAPNRVLKQSVRVERCCNFIPALDGPMPISIVGAASWENVAGSVAISLPPDDAGSFALFGLRAKFAAGSFFHGGLGLPTGIFAAVDGEGLQLIGAVADAAKGLVWPCAAGSRCLGSIVFSKPGRGVWRRISLSAAVRTLRYSCSDEGTATTKTMTMTLPAGMATGAGFGAIAASYGSAVEL